MREGWKEKTIGEVCDVVNGGTPKTSVSGYWDGPYQWITPAEMGKRVTPYIQETERTITAEGLQNSSARLLPPYSVILSSRAPIGYLVINTAPMATNQGCKGLVPTKEIDHKFLFYYLTSIVELLNELGSGATFKELSGGKLKEIPVPIAPLPEQQRIVAILDEAFEGIATAKANAEKNLQNAREVFESHLNTVFSQRGEGWEEKRLGDVCKRITVGHVGQMAKQYRSSGIPFLRSQNIRPFAIDLDNVVFIDEEFHSYLEKSSLEVGDIAIVRTGYPGTAAVIPESLGVANCSDLVIVRPGIDIDGHFLAAFFNSQYGKQLVLGKIVGAAQKHFNVSAAKETLIYIPPVTEQLGIVRAANKLRQETQHLESIYQQKLTALGELKQSLLHQAFNGDL